MDNTITGSKSDATKILAHEQVALGKKIHEGKTYHEVKKNIKNATHTHQKKNVEKVDKPVV